MEYLKVILFLLLATINTGYSKPSHNTDREYNYYDDEQDGEQKKPDKDYQAEDEYVYDDDLNSTDSSKGLSNNNEVFNNEVHHGPTYFDVDKISLSGEYGKSLLLPCDVKNPKSNTVIFWYNGTDTNHLISTGTKVMPAYANHAKVHDDHSLEIFNLDIGDITQYQCKIFPERIALTVNVVAREDLGIFYKDIEYTNKQLSFRQGDSAEFQCKSFSRNKPTLLWSLDGERAENHVSRIIDGTIIIDHIDSHHAGNYLCLGDYKNEQANLPKAVISIVVHYSPKVHTHRHYVNTDIGDHPELYCDYKAVPIGMVEWKKDGRQLDPVSYKYNIEEKIHKGKNRTILRVKDVKEEDLGEYHCEVTNTVGIGSNNVHLILEPETPQFEDIKIDGRNVTIFWLDRSKQSLIEAALNYKMNKSFNWMVENIVETNKHPEHHHTGFWKLRHEIELTEGEWMVRVRTKNKHGWSKFSPQYDFIIKEDTFENFIPEEASNGGSNMPEEIVLAGLGGSGRQYNSEVNKDPNGSPSIVVSTLTLGLCLLINLVPFIKISRIGY